MKKLSYKSFLGKLSKYLWSLQDFIFGLTSTSDAQHIQKKLGVEFSIALINCGDISKLFSPVLFPSSLWGGDFCTCQPLDHEAFCFVITKSNTVVGALKRRNKMRCRDWTDCYFFQECEPDPICLGHCQLSAWFISSIVWASIGTLCIIVACFRCAFCPLHKYLVERGNLPSVAGNSNRSVVNRMPSDYKSRLPTFEEVVLVRSLSEHNKWRAKDLYSHYVFIVYFEVYQIVSKYVNKYYTVTIMPYQQHSYGVVGYQKMINAL